MCNCQSRNRIVISACEQSHVPMDVNNPMFPMDVNNPMSPMDVNNPMSPMDANFYVPHGCEQSHVPYPSMQFQFNFISCKYLVFIFTMFSLQAIYSEMLHIYVANNSMFLMQTNSFCSWYFCKPLIPPEMMFHVTI